MREREEKEYGERQRHKHRNRDRKREIKEGEKKERERKERAVNSRLPVTPLLFIFNRRRVFIKAVIKLGDTHTLPVTDLVI